MDRKIEETVALGGTQILMQGRASPKLTKQWYLDLLSHIKNKFRRSNIHGFSPSEFIHFREAFNEPLGENHRRFHESRAGLDSRRRRGNSRGSRAPESFAAQGDERRLAEVMDVAHGLGLCSSATMMFGHVETVEDRIEHLERLRTQQDKSLHRRTAVPLSPFFPKSQRQARRLSYPAISPRSSAVTFQAEHTKLKAPTVGAHEYCGRRRWAASFSIISPTFKFVGDTGQKSARWPSSSVRTTRQHHDRGKRCQPGRRPPSA